MPAKPKTFASVHHTLRGLALAPSRAAAAAKVYRGFNAYDRRSTTVGGLASRTTQVFYCPRTGLLWYRLAVWEAGRVDAIDPTQVAPRQWAGIAVREAPSGPEFAEGPGVRKPGRRQHALTQAEFAKRQAPGKASRPARRPSGGPSTARARPPR